LKLSKVPLYFLLNSNWETSFCVPRSFGFVIMNSRTWGGILFLDDQLQNHTATIRIPLSSFTVQHACDPNLIDASGRS
ncbi:hypothetical protein P4I20_31540, partial [Paenibacillus graminis]